MLVMMLEGSVLNDSDFNWYFYVVKANQQPTTQEDITEAGWPHDEKEANSFGNVTYVCLCLELG